MDLDPREESRFMLAVVAEWMLWLRWKVSSIISLAMCNYSKVHVLLSSADIDFVCSDYASCSDCDLRYAHVVHGQLFTSIGTLENSFGTLITSVQ